MVLDQAASIARILARRAACACLVALCAHPAAAQSLPVSVEAVAAADAAVDSTVSRHPTSWLDLFGALRVVDGLDLTARPLVTRRSFDGDWQVQMYELGARYERGRAYGVRANVGLQPSPIGLALLTNRPDLNPVVSINSAYYLPLPVFEPGAPRVNLIAAAYPLGATMTVSGPRWDARVAAIDSSPTRARPVFGDGRPPRMANTVIGAGLSPRVGLRLGAAFARGPYARAEEMPDPSTGDRTATVVQAETEWAFGHTKIAGEFVHSTFETATADAVAQGGWVEGVQTLAPRWFVAGRVDHQWIRFTRALTGSRAREAYSRTEAVVGYRLTPELTLRGGYLGRKGYVVFHWDDQLVGSIVWSRRF